MPISSVPLFFDFSSLWKHTLGDKQLHEPKMTQIRWYIYALPGQNESNNAFSRFMNQSMINAMLTFSIIDMRLFI